jgi:apolipoprotein N-acyltransferase
MNVFVSSIVVSGEGGGGGCGGSGCLLSVRVCVWGGVIGADGVCGWSSIGKLKVIRFGSLGGVFVVSFLSITLKNFEFRVTWWSVRLAVIIVPLIATTWYGLQSNRGVCLLERSHLNRTVSFS